MIGPTPVRRACCGSCASGGSCCGGGSNLAGPLDTAGVFLGGFAVPLLAIALFLAWGQWVGPMAKDRRGALAKEKARHKQAVADIRREYSIFREVRKRR